MQFRAVHENYNVSDLEVSLRFYREALGLEEVRRKQTDKFTIVFLKNGNSDFELELTQLKDHPQKYDLGECEFHLAITADNYQEALKFHQKNGWVCFVNEAMGIYFIEDPDGYWIEILPPQK